MMQHQVVCLASPGSTVHEIDVEREILEATGAKVDLVYADSEAATLAAVVHADAILHRGGCLTSAVIRQLERSRIIAHGGVGYDAIDVDAATANGIMVTNVADYCVEEVANQALVLLLALSKRLVPQIRNVHTGRWMPEGAGTVQRLSEQTVAIIGFGRIGSSFGERVRSLGLRMLVVDPYVPADQILARGGVPSELGTALGEADYVSLHLPLNSATRHLIGAAELRQMKPSAYIINTARGGVVDEAALAAALTAGQIAGAGLDVLEQEPPDPANPLLNVENVLVTPHAAYYSEASLQDVRRTMAKQVVAALGGQIPRFLVNPEVLSIRGGARSAIAADRGTSTD